MAVKTVRPPTPLCLPFPYAPSPILPTFPTFEQPRPEINYRRFSSTSRTNISTAWLFFWTGWVLESEHNLSLLLPLLKSFSLGWAGDRERVCCLLSISSCLSREIGWALWENKALPYECIKNWRSFHIDVGGGFDEKHSMHNLKKSILHYQLINVALEQSIGKILVYVEFCVDRFTKWNSRIIYVHRLRIQCNQTASS